MLEHKHLILKGSIRRPVGEFEVAHALRAIVGIVGMKELSPPYAVRCYEPDNVGVTGVILLTTSHMVWHDWDTKDGSDLQFDLYSCANFKVADVEDYLKSEFRLRDYEYRLFDRKYNITEMRAFAKFG